MLRVLSTLIALVLLALPAHAQGSDPRAILDAYGEAFIAGADGFDDTEALIDALGATGDPAAARPLRTIQGGDLYVREADGAVFAARRGGAGYLLSDPFTSEAAGEAERGAMDKVRVKNSLRRRVDAALSGLTLRSERRAARLNAAATIFRRSDASAIEALEAVIPEERDAEVRMAFNGALAAARLGPDAEDVAESDLRDAVATLAGRGDLEARTRLAAFATRQGQIAAEGDGDPVAAGLAREAEAAVAAIDRSLAFWAGAQNVWFGLSLGSVLFLAAIGLAITFGVMGVINMAHGEMVMLGAYTTFAVQEAIRLSAPGLFDVSLLIALPLAFLVAGAVGLAMERGIIRFLYGRPLETLDFGECHGNATTTSNVIGQLSPGWPVGR